MLSAGKSPWPEAGKISLGEPVNRLAWAVALLVAIWYPTVAGAVPQAGAESVGTGASAEAIPVEGSMTLTGRIAIGADRDVSSHVIDHEEQVPEEVKAFLARQIAGWRVGVDDGVELPPEAVVRFTVQVRASPAGDGLYGLWLDGVNLDEPLPASRRVSARRLRPPVYPTAMAKVGAGGIVYMQVLLDAEGRVEDVFAEQVDLTTLPDEPADVINYQLEFIAHAAAAARRWRFSMPSEGPYAGKRHVLRIPVDFTLADKPEPGYGQWRFLVRGVRRVAPWLSADGGARARDDGIAVAGGDLQLASSRIWVVRPDG